jgi:RNA recognition motif-containing protein
MSTDEEAQKAIEMFNGKELDGRAIVVNEARPMTERPPRRNFGGGGRGFGGGYGNRDRF